MAIEIKAYNSKQLAAIYGVSTKLFSEWLKDLKEIEPQLKNHKRRIFTPAQVKLIVKHLDEPEC